MNRRFTKDLFEAGCDVIIADEIKNGMIIALSNCEYFYVDDVDKFFKDEESAKIYDKKFDKKILPEHTIITLYDEVDNCISNIPAQTPVIAYKRIIGNHCKSK